MIDIEKVIKGLECCAYKENCDECPYIRGNAMCLSYKDKDALELLKKQEPKATIITHQNEYCKDGKCPSCGHEIETNMHPKYCGYCGQAVKWSNEEPYRI